MFKFLYRRKEILIFFTHSDSKVRINLEGKIIFYKGKKPEIFFEFFECNKRNQKKYKNYLNEGESEDENDNCCEDGYKQ